VKNLVLIGGLFFGSFVAVLRAGSVVTLTDAHEVNGKLTLDPATVHVEGPFPSEINLPDILEADFSDAPFHLDYFSSVGDTSSPLPAGWKGEAIGQAVVPGSLSYASGVFTLTSNQWDPPNDKDQTDHYFLAGLSWMGDGQWTVRVKGIDAPNAGLQGGFMLRDSLDPISAMIGAAASNWGMATMFARSRENSTWSNSTPTDDLPVWFRLTRRGPSVDFELSGDGRQWSLSGLSTVNMAESIWAGFFINSHRGKADQKVVLDQALFVPAPGPAPGRIVPTGVLLRSGSFLAGYFNPLDFNRPAPVGKFTRNGKDCAIAVAQTAAAVYHPVRRSQLAEVEPQVGVILKNDDFMAGSFEAINAGGVRLDSIPLGYLQYDRDQICACTLNPMEPRPADYEIRLKDGSIIRAKGISVNNGQFSIEEISGISVMVAPDEITQFRAGPSRVQTLLDLAWKATPSLPPSAPPAVHPAAVTSTNAAPVANPAPPANPAPDQSPPAQCWTGNNQEQIMVASAGTTVDIPLTGKFRALAMHVALSPDSPPNSQATLRILADGREIARTPPFKAGDQPRFMQVTLSDPKTVTLAVDSIVDGTRVLFIDPVAIRENVAPTP